MPARATKPRIDRGQLQQIITGVAEGVLLIDPDGTIVWANEAALAMHGCARLEEMGTTATRYRRRFVLKYLNHHPLTAKQYPLARVIAGDAFAELTVQVTRRDDETFCRVHHVRSLQLTDARQNVESLVLVVRDVTGWLSAEERFEHMFAANPAPALICRLSDARYIKVNQGFMDMTGYPRDAVIDVLFHELDVLDQAEHRDEALACLHDNRTIHQQEAVVRMADGNGKFVIVAGQPIECGDEDCMLFTFIDLEARKQAETSLRYSEERFSKAFRLAPVPMLVCAQHGWRIVEVNDAFAAVTGYSHPDIVGQSVADAGFWVDAKSLREMGTVLDAKLVVRNREVSLRTRDNTMIDCLLSAEPVTIQDEACVLCVIQDITARKRSEMDLVAAIEAVMKDASWFSRTVMEKLAQLRHAGSGGSKSELAALTAREREILELICKGQTDAEIATELKLSRNTVRNHVATLYSKLGVNRRSAAVVWGRERGVVGY